MKNLKSMLIGTAGVVLAGLILTLGASEEARAAGLARAPYSQTETCYSASTNQCTATFPAVPAGKLLVVQYVASSVDTPTALESGEFDVDGQAFIPMLYTLQGSDPGGNKIYVGNQAFLYYFQAGQQPYFVMNAQSGGFEFMSGQVTLTGYITGANTSLDE